ncbi:hypothetical protein [Streptomyces carminius]|uniref:hypothetical protein n=1 Tax=Streptomyces carminius TaxID=2665496 RepID=UPI0018EBC7B1|nr:hypothetical protein [Streptomyces carminius]
MVTGKVAVLVGVTAATADGVTGGAVSTVVRTEAVRTGIVVSGETSSVTTGVVTSAVVMSEAASDAVRTVIGRVHGDTTVGISGAPGLRAIVGGSVVMTTAAVTGGGSVPRMSVLRTVVMIVPRTAVVSAVMTAVVSVPRTVVMTVVVSGGTIAVVMSGVASGGVRTGTVVSGGTSGVTTRVPGVRRVTVPVAATAMTRAGGDPTADGDATTGGMSVLRTVVMIVVVSGVMIVPRTAVVSAVMTAVVSVPRTVVMTVVVSGGTIAVVMSGVASGGVRTGTVVSGGTSGVTTRVPGVRRVTVPVAATAMTRAGGDPTADGDVTTAEVTGSGGTRDVGATGATTVHVTAVRTATLPGGCRFPRTSPATSWTRKCGRSS